MTTTVEELHQALGAIMDAGKGKLPVAFGDCNSLHLVTAIGLGRVEELTTYYLEEIDPDCGEGVEVYVIGE